MYLLTQLIFAAIFFLLSITGLILFVALLIKQIRLMKLGFEIVDLAILGMLLIILFVAIGACCLGFDCINSIK